MKDKLGAKIMIKFVGLRATTNRYLKDDGSEVNKAKDTKKCVIKKQLQFESYKSCLEATQLKNKINHLEKNKINLYSLKKCHKEFIINNKTILKRQQSFKKEKHDAFTEEIDKIIF